MAKSELIGLCDCPECDFPDAEVRNDKGGHPYRFCPDCTAQYFTRGNPVKVRNLLALLRREGAPPGEQQQASVAPVVPSAVEDTTAAAPAQAKKKNHWFPDLIGGAQ